ncbi:MAG TPA: tRNA lysidine(34) synthetase TilS [Geopsychrobacteraceae bacterium]
MPRALLKELEQNPWIVPGARLLVALSGGVDSVVLLHLLQRLAPERGLNLAAAHLDHGIRPESGDDARFVSALCRKGEIPLTLERCDVPALARDRRLSLEMAAREARREFLLRTAARQQAEYIVLAHHRDDQAETFLLRLLRGSGLSGLCGMQPRRGSWLRPLLQLGRQQVLDYARDWQLVWVEDLSNRDDRYLRNRVRHELLPQLRRYNPRLEERLDLLCRQQQVEEDFWTQLIGTTLPAVIISRDDGLRLCRRGLLNLHPALRLRTLREAIRLLRGNLQGVTEKHLAAVAHLLHTERSQASVDLPGLWAARRYQQLWLCSSAPESDRYGFELQVPGDVALPEGSLLRAEFADAPRGESDSVVEFAAQQLVFPLQVRSFRPGDRFRPAGTGGGKKLKDFFIDIKLEREQRQRVPLVVSGGEILWVAGVRRSACAPAGKKSGRVLRLELVRGSIQG